MVQHVVKLWGLCVAAILTPGWWWCACGGVKEGSVGNDPRSAFHGTKNLQPLIGYSTGCVERASLKVRTREIKGQIRVRVKTS